MRSLQTMIKAEKMGYQHPFANAEHGTHKRYNYYLLLTMASSCGHMTIPELRNELEKFGAKKSGRKRELVER